MDITKFGSESCPIHASWLPLMLRCPLSTVLRIDDPGPGSKAADTGSAAHHAIANWHRNQGLNEAIERMKAAAPEKFRLADLEVAEAYAQAYTRDARHPRTLEVEKVVSCEVDGVWFTGTLDQLRLNEMGRLSVWDLKTGEDDGNKMKNDYAAQIAAYSVMADVDPGGIIRLRDYVVKSRTPERRAALAAGSPVGVFYPVNFSKARAREIVQEAVAVVKEVRAGRIRVAPGAYCGYCPGCGPEFCLDRREVVIGR